MVKCDRLRRLWSNILEILAFCGINPVRRHGIVRKPKTRAPQLGPAAGPETRIAAHCDSKRCSMCGAAIEWVWGPYGRVRRLRGWPLRAGAHVGECGDSTAAGDKRVAAQSTFPRHFRGAGVCFADCGVDPTGCLCHGSVLMFCFLLDRVTIAEQRGMNLTVVCGGQVFSP